MLHEDTVCLKHILDASQKALEFTRDKARTDLENNEMLALSLVRLLEIIGEAANAVSSQFQAKHPSIPWRKMIALRNRLINGYFDINLDIVWDTVLKDLPPLIEQIQRIMPSATEGEPIKS
jgi:uncharacterized protein with HEPN domain